MQFSNYLLYAAEGYKYIVKNQTYFFLMIKLNLKVTTLHPIITFEEKKYSSTLLL